MEENLIYEYEESLRKAMVNSDVENLDKLLSDKLAFVSPFGHVITKEDDMKFISQGCRKLLKLNF